MRNSMAQDIDHILLSEEQIKNRVMELGAQLSEDYDGLNPIVLCVLKGATVFFTDIIRAMDIPLAIDFMGISSYGDAVKTSGIIKITKDMDSSITGRHVLIAEDIMDSGLTLTHLKKLLMERKPLSIKVCCMLDKPERREVDIQPDYCGFTIPNEFVVGYGLDYQQKYRNLPYIGVLKPEVYSK